MGYKANITHLLELDNGIIIGDFNAHHPLWHSNLNPDQRGEDIVDQIDVSNYGVKTHLLE
jgi:hypothetical protein